MRRLFLSGFAAVALALFSVPMMAAAMTPPPDVLAHAASIDVKLSLALDHSADLAVAPALEPMAPSMLPEVAGNIAAYASPTSTLSANSAVPGVAAHLTIASAGAVRGLNIACTDYGESS